MIGKVFSWIGGIVVVLVVIGFFAGGTKEQTVTSANAKPSQSTASQQVASTPANDPSPDVAAPEQTVGKVGQRVESTGVGLSVLKVRQQSQVSEYLKPEAGNTYLIVEVVIENLSKEKAPYNPLYFKVKDAEGFEHNASFIGVEPVLKSGELRAGGKSRGFVTFEVPKTSKGFVLSYEPLVIFGGYEPIEFNLGI